MCGSYSLLFENVFCFRDQKSEILLKLAWCYWVSWVEVLALNIFYYSNFTAIIETVKLL